jgi:hypothetical protein
MRLFQKPVEKNSQSTFLRVDDSTFAELVDLRGENYLFNIVFKLSLSSNKKTLSDYDKVKITVKNKENNKLKSRASSYSNQISETTSRISNTVSNSQSLSSTLKPKNGISRAILTSKVSEKLYSGLQMLNALETKEDFLEQVEISINPYIDAVVFNRYAVTELSIPDYKPLKKELRVRESRVRESTVDEEAGLSTVFSTVDPTDTMTRINKELVDITEPVTDQFSLNLSSDSYLENPEFRMSFISRGKGPLSYDIAKYYLDIKGSPSENSLTWYEAKETIKDIDYVDIETILQIGKGNRNSNLDVRFDLYKRGSNVVDESYTTTLYTASHVEAFHAQTIPPTISSLIIKNNLCQLLIDSKEVYTSAYNVYLKNVFQDGSVSSYEKIGSVKRESESPSTFSFYTTTDLSIVRVIPVDSKGKESNIFTNSVVGPGHRVLGKPIILPAHFGKNEVRIDVLRLPKNTIGITLYRRDCTENIDSKFLLVETVQIRTGNNDSVTVMDRSAITGRIYEYYLVALSASETTGEEIPIISNYVMFKCLPNNNIEKSINVVFRPGQASSNGSVSFQLSTTIAKSENERITENLKTQLGELYSQYLDPANNAASPLGDAKGIPQYSDLIFHEIVRTNLSTGERETFDLISDGSFVDGSSSQRNFNIKPLNPQHAYYYSVFTFKKNPLELFKKFVARGVDTKGKEWFYLPYKWKNPSVKMGKLFADDDQGIPVVDAYESFTSEAFGLTASYQTSQSVNSFVITQTVATRLDRNTVKITWNIDESSTLSNQSFYDSFVVMKVVNGTRSFVGRTHKNYIYHELNERDLGTVYYIIVPIMSEFDIGEAAFSNDILIEPDGLAVKTKVINQPSALR